MEAQKSYNLKSNEETQEPLSFVINNSSQLKKRGWNFGEFFPGFYSGV